MKDSPADKKERRRQQQNAAARARYAARHAEFLEKGRARRELNKETLRETSRRWRKNNPEKTREYYTKDPAKNLFLNARNRSKKTGLEFNLDPSDVVVPAVCPVFGTPFVLGGGSGFHHHAPTLDRIDNSKGYVKGNVQVISWRANRIKCDATVAELQQLLEYMTR